MGCIICIILWIGTRKIKVHRKGCDRAKKKGEFNKCDLSFFFLLCALQKKKNTITTYYWQNEILLFLFPLRMLVFDFSQLEYLPCRFVYHPIRRQPASGPFKIFLSVKCRVVPVNWYSSASKYPNVNFQACLHCFGGSWNYQVTWVPFCQKIGQATESFGNTWVFEYYPMGFLGGWHTQTRGHD